MISSIVVATLLAAFVGASPLAATPCPSVSAVVTHSAPAWAPVTVTVTAPSKPTIATNVWPSVTVTVTAATHDSTPSAPASAGDDDIEESSSGGELLGGLLGGGGLSGSGLGSLGGLGGLTNVGGLLGGSTSSSSSGSSSGGSASSGSSSSSSGTSPAIPAGQCNTSNIQCCNQVQESHSANHHTKSLLGLLGVDLSSLTGQIGLQCSPIPILGVSGGVSCTSQPVCCSNNSFNGLVALGCTPINLSL